MQEAPLKIKDVRIKTRSPLDQMQTTIRLIGEAISKGAQYLPIRNLAASLATKAAPKDYVGQCREIYNYLVQNWRYVKDPVVWQPGKGRFEGLEMIVTHPKALYEMIIGKHGGVGSGKGAGDCDDAAVAVGSLCGSIGIPVRIVTTARRRPGSDRRAIYSHVFIQAKIPKKGWLTIDPVGYPKHYFGWHPPYIKIAYWNLDGKKVSEKKNLMFFYGPQKRSFAMRPLISDESASGILEGNSIHGFEGSVGAFQDYGLHKYGLAQYDASFDDIWDWQTQGVLNFGSLHGELGYIDGDDPGLNYGYGLLIEAEVDPQTGLAHTPMLEISPEDFGYMQEVGTPYDGMLALSDTADIYYYDGLGGFFSKIWGGIKKVGKAIGRGVKKVVKKVVKTVVKYTKKFISALPGGKYLVKLGEKIVKVAKKLIKPLIKFVGKYAKKLAPIAALIPGFGPAISAGLHTAGRIAKIMTKFDVKLTGEKGKKQVRFKSGKQAKRFKAALKKAAKREKRKQARAKRRGIALPGTRDHKRRIARRGIPGRVRKGLARRYLARFRPRRMPYPGMMPYMMPYPGMMRRPAMMRRPGMMPKPRRRPRAKAVRRPPIMMKPLIPTATGLRKRTPVV